jgi:hypothetical protein
MKELKAYVEQVNKWNAIFGGTQYSLSSASDRQKLANKIDADLSPENLTCDGELPAATVRARHKKLTAVAKQLMALDPTVSFYEYA